jgi:hypothetical protein
MAEFTFSCPQCGKGIQCDARYAGSQINCPNCQQVVAVPSTALPDAAPGREVIQIKKSAMRNILAVAAAIIVLAGLVSVGWHLWFGNPKLAGDWKMGGPYNVGKPCQILQSGNELTFVNENGAQSSGVFKSKSVVIALDWEGGIRGTLNKNATRINWKNGTWWIREKSVTSKTTPQADTGWTSREVAAADSVQGRLQSQGKQWVRTTGEIAVGAYVQDLLEGRLDQPKGRGAIGKVVSISKGNNNAQVAVVDFGRDYSVGISLSELSLVNVTPK